MRLRSIAEEHGWESEEMKANISIMNEVDSLNLIVIQDVLDTKGWAGPDVAGGKGNATLFLVIQHSPLEVQEKYLPMMRDAVELGNAQSSQLALLEDRVSLRKNGYQLYGSQIGRDDNGQYYVSPVKDPDTVDERRAAMGLSPLAEYTFRYGFTWDVEKHKERHGMEE